jgi:hypothetical protein
LLTIEVDGAVPPIPLDLFAGSGILMLAICKTHNIEQGREKIIAHTITKGGKSDAIK